jgi:hypothetical protein
MSGKLQRFAVALFPNCKAFRLHLWETTCMAAQRRRMIADASRINDLAGRLHSIDDARELVELVAADGLPKWVTRSIRDLIARAEYRSASTPGSLISEQHVANVWNDYLRKIGAPEDSCVTQAEIHTLRDRCYFSSQIMWTRDNQNIWTVPNIYALGQDGKVADGCRALEALNILWELSNQPEILKHAHELVEKGQLSPDIFKTPANPPAPGSERGIVTLRQGPQNHVRQAALQYKRDHGAPAADGAIEELLKTLVAD